jgi:hypothetical protein
MKLYGIACHGELRRSSLLAAAKKIAQEQLSKETVNNYGVGFIGVHDGRDAAFVFVDFWGNENELFHRVFLSRDNDPEKLAPAAPADSSVCVWDLHLQSLSARLGSAMCCAKLARPISMIILPSVCTKMPNF